MFNSARVFAILAICLFLAGCAGEVAFKKGEKYAVEGDMDRAVAYYRQALQQDPENIDYITRLTKAQDQAAIKHMDRALHYLQEKNPEAAIYEAEQANIYSPNNDKARQLLNKARKLKDMQDTLAVGRSYLSAGRPSEALDQFYKVLDMDPENKIAKEYVERITKEKVEEEEADELSLGSTEPITLSFKDAKLKEVFEFLSKISGISILFDEDVKDQPVTVFAKDVSFKQALNLLLATNKLFMKKIAKDAIIIIPKTKSKLDQYQDLIIRTFYLSNIQAKDMVNILRTMLETRKVIINDTLNSITLRETPDKLKLAEKLIAANDRKDSEVIIDVTVMSVDRGPDQINYGIAWPTSVTGTVVPGGLGALGTAAAGTIPTVTTSWLGEPGTKPGLKDAIHSFGKNLIFSYPAATATLQETKSKAETLTNPQIRTLNNKPAKILIGSRIPVQTGTAVAGAITTTTFEYRDVGIKLTVEPNIGVGGDVKLKTTLEVSSLGANITVGTSQQPTFNTTTAETVLSLRDSETVIIGGLLENTDGSAATGIAGIMDVPILGKIFSSNTVGPNRKRELLMTLTPHIIRPLEVPGAEATSFWSGTEEAYDTKPLFEEKKERLSAPEEAAAEEQVAPAPAAPSGPAAEEGRQGIAVQPTAPAQPAPAAPTAPAAPGAPAQPAPTAPAQPGAAAQPAPAAPTVPAQPAPTAPAKPGAAAQPAPGKPGAKKPPQAEEEKPVAVPAPQKIGRVGTLSFAPEVVPISVGQEITVDVMATDLDSVFEAPLSIIYNPKLVKFVKAEEGTYMNVDKKATSFMVTANEKIGVIDIMLTRLGRVPGVAGSGKLFSLTFKGLAPGISPMVFKQNNLRDVRRAIVPADLKTGTLYVK